MDGFKHINTPFAHRCELYKVGEKVSSLLLIDYELTYGTASVKMGGIAGVQTHPEHRKRGYASELLEDTIAWMAREQYPCSFLFGIPGFYWRYGYATLLTHAKTEVRYKDVGELEPTGFAIRPFAKKDVEAIRQLHNANAKGRMCTILRSEEWQGIPRGSDWPIEATCLVVESMGGLEGYFVYDTVGPKVIVSEVETRDPVAQYAVLEAVVKLGLANGEQTFCYLGPTSHPFSVFLRRFGAEHTDYVEPHGFGMGRLIHLPSFFGQIIPELERRSWLLPEGTQCSLGIQTEIGQCCLEITRGTVGLVEVKGQSQNQVSCKQLELSRLVFGVLDYRSFSVSPETQIQGNPGLILQTLFPTGLNTIPPTSWF